MQLAVPGLTHSAMLDASPIPTSVVDAKGTVVYVNEAFLAYARNARGVEIRREDRIGRNIREFITGGYGYNRQEWLEIYDRLLKQGEAVFLQEVHARLPSDREMYVDVRMNPITGEDGRVIGAVLTWQDATDRANAQREERRRAALDRVRVSVYEMREAADIQNVLVSLYGALKNVGMEFDNCSVQLVDEGKKNFEGHFLGPDWVHPMRDMGSLRDSAVYEAWRDQRPVYRRDLDEEDKYNEKTGIREGAGGQPIRSVLDVPFSQGTVAINSMRPEAFSKADIETLKQFAGVLSEAYTRFEDIRGIEESEERYRALFEQAADSIVLVDAGTGVLVEFNDRAHENLGYSREEFEKLTIPDFEVIESAEEVTRHIEKIIKQGTDTFETKHRTKAGEIRDILVSSRAISIQGRDFVQSIWRDITERKLALEGLRESEEKYRDLFQNARDVIVTIGLKGNVTSVNKAITEYGFQEDEVVGQNILKFVSKKYWPRLLKELATIAQGSPIEGEIELLTPKGEKIAEYRSNPIRRDKKVVGLQTILRDITERKQALEALRESEERYRTLIQQSVEAIYMFDPETKRVLEANPAFLELLGYTTEEVPTLSIYDFIAHSRESIDAHIQRIVRSGGITVGERAWRRRDGSLIDAQVTGSKIRQGGREIVFVVARDITEHKKMEAELLKVEKLESLGVLAGGIAHDFNNILTAILGNISLTKMSADPEDKVFERLIEAEKASLRARDLTQQLLTFSKGGAPVKKTASIGELVRESASFALRGSNVRCEFSLPDALWQVEVDEGQISQVIHNLVINADQAMPEGGTIRIQAENLNVSKEMPLSLGPGKYVKVSVEDQGVGIPEEYLSKIFDPYFTTKQKGSGLGLATAYSIIRNHKGQITVNSELGVGTSFFIYLPASKAEVLTKKTVKERSLVGKGRILVMDDEEMVREVAGQMLSHLGYQVELAGDGAEAIERYQKARESGQPFDAVIMDLTIPGGLGGQEAIKKLLEIDPEAKALVSSGYSTAPIMSNFKQYGFRGVVVKPYKITELSETLHKVIQD